MINFYSLIDKSLLLYFKCDQGHYTSCRTGMQVFYCTKCKKMFNKKDCERFSDRPTSKVYKKGIRIRLSPTKTLYKFTDSVRRNYRKKISKWIPQPKTQEIFLLFARTAVMHLDHTLTEPIGKQSNAHTVIAGSSYQLELQTPRRGFERCTTE